MSQRRSVSRADSVAISSTVRLQVLVVVERRQGGDLGGGGDGPGLLARRSRVIISGEATA